ncbi:MAG: DUF3868 domain-containing protein [Paraprevotella sp.]|nr:DUF3868 domain-containing protein [Paraprevotella sp.]
MKYYLFYALAAAWMISPAAAMAKEREAGFVRIDSVYLQPAGRSLLVEMQLRLDSVNIGADRLLAYTPVLEGDNGQKKTMKPVLITGLDQHYVYLREGNENNPEAWELRRKNGTRQSYHYTFTVPFESWMIDSKLSVMEDLCGCGDLLNENKIPVKSVDYHPERDIMLAFVTPKVEERKVRQESGEAFLDFPVNKTVIYPEYRNNPRELHKIIATIDLVRNDTNTVITGIGIHGYASPEGGYANNERLAQGRAEALRTYVSQLYRLSPDIFSVKSTPEDWDGLRKYVKSSSMASKLDMLEIINRTDLDPDAREARLRQSFPADYRFLLDNVYPGLRHSDYTVTYIVRPFSVAETRQIMKTRPAQLSLNEMFMVAQSYRPGSADYNQVFAEALKYYPDDPVANLNAAIYAINRRDLKGAEAYLAKAGDSPEAVHARGVWAMLSGQYDRAEAWLLEAKVNGVKEAESNLKVLDKLKAMQ